MPESFDHIVIGGGILGLSIAYHLVRDSRDSVLVIECNELASAASSKAAGLILQATSKSIHTPFAKLTRDVIPELAAQQADETGFHSVGSLRVASSAARASDLKRMEQDAQRHGILFRNLSPDEAQGKAPWLDLQTARRITFFPTDGYIDPYMFSMAYGRTARALGAQIRLRTAVTDLIINAERVLGVRTSSGDIYGGSVIDAGGAWASLISARAGYPLPIAPTRSHYWITAPSSAYGADFPVTLLPDAGAYARPEVGGMILGLQEACSPTFDARELPDDINMFSPTRGEEHWDILGNAMEAVSVFFPTMPQAQFSSYVSGLSTYTPDGTLILGAVPGCTGLIAASGCCGNGITLSAGIGSSVSALSRGEKPTCDLAPFAPDRFGAVDPFSLSFRDRCAEARASKSLNKPLL